MDLLITKGLHWLVAAFGGLAISVFYVPKKLMNLTVVQRTFVIGGVCGSMGAVFTGLVVIWASKQLGFDPTDWNYVLPIALVVGASSLTIVITAANFFRKSEGKDIVEVVKDLKGE
jgi:branched-subunit amino acid ABC-type transport system permease component